MIRFSAKRGELITMLRSAGPPNSDGEANERVVVLLLPDLLGELADPASLRATLVGDSRRVRVLLCLPESTEQPIATLLTEIGVEVQILLGPHVEAPAETNAFILRAPPSTSPDDQTEFALALADVVLVGSIPDQNPWKQTATKLKKKMVAPGEPLPALSTPASITHRLDPHRPGRPPRRRRGFGRFEQAILEGLAFNWRGWSKGGVSKSYERLRKCLGLTWHPGAYFAPEGWQEKAPDRSALDASSR